MSGCRKVYCPQRNTPACSTVPLIRDYEADEQEKAREKLMRQYVRHYKCLQCGTRYRIADDV